MARDAELYSSARLWRTAIRGQIVLTVRCRIDKGIKAVFKETESLSENTESYETSDNANKSWTETLIIR